MSAFDDLINHDLFLKGVVPPGKPAGCSGSDSGGSFGCLDFLGASISASFTGSNFLSCNFNQASISGSSFSNVSFQDCNFSSTSISSSRFDNCTFNSCKFQGTSFLGAVISNSFLESCLFNDCTGDIKWYGSQLKDGHHIGCNLKG